MSNRTNGRINQYRFISSYKGQRDYMYYPTGERVVLIMGSDQIMPKYNGIITEQMQADWDEFCERSKASFIDWCYRRFNHVPSSVNLDRFVP